MATKSRQRIVILGAGFGGLYTALGLEKLDRFAEVFDVTLVNRDNYFTMTPLLFEAGSGIIEPRHAVTPIRTLLRKSRFVEADVEGVDFSRSVVTVRNAPSLEALDLPFDHLVFALGGVTNTRLIPGSEYAFTFKTLADAIFLRNHLIDIFERAVIEPAPQKRRDLLCVVIIGGGLVGVELCGEVNQFLKHLCKSYPAIPSDQMTLHLIDSGEQILSELEPDLAQHAYETLVGRGVNIRRKTRVRAIEAGRVLLPDDSELRSATIILAAGVAPAPVLQRIDLPKDRRGKLQTSGAMQVQGTTNVWALGDCAAVPDPDGQPYPPLAQHALRQARVLAKNLLATARGEPLQPFVYTSLGALASLGHFNGVGKLMNVKIRGFLAWWVWRTYYLSQMPRWDRKIRLVIDWTTALFFKYDIVKLDLFGQAHPIHGPASAEKAADDLDDARASSLTDKNVTVVR